MESQMDWDSDRFRINHGEGLTPTEQLLKFLGERSFLRFWSHANPHVTPTQELCDLLVVCGDYVIAFSDKSCEFQAHTVREVAWGRWYRAAVEKSVRQLNGAVRHLTGLGSQIYKDNTCTVPLGLPVPTSDQAKVYRIAVATKSKAIAEASQPQPFLNIDGGLSGNQHLDLAAVPFSVGDPCPNAAFVHVMDLAGLWAVLSELDTIVDFARYLDARQAFIRAKGRNIAANEWCLLTRYLFSFTPDGVQLPLDYANPGFTRLGNGEWQAESTKRALKARREANQESRRIWDALIERQAVMVEQQSFEFTTYHTVQETERVVRHMALEPRLHRRMLSRMWKEACLAAEPGQVMNLRTAPHGPDTNVTYIFLTMLETDEMTQAEYRKHRLELLKHMVLASIIDVPTSEIIVGFASELGQAPDSRDHLYFNVVEDANPETLLVDARASWEFKRQIVSSRRHGRVDDREFPAI